MARVSAESASEQGHSFDAVSLLYGHGEPAAHKAGIQSKYTSAGTAQFGGT